MRRRGKMLAPSGATIAAAIIRDRWPIKNSPHGALYVIPQTTRRARHLAK